MFVNPLASAQSLLPVVAILSGLLCCIALMLLASPDTLRYMVSVVRFVLIGIRSKLGAHSHNYLCLDYSVLGTLTPPLPLVIQLQSSD